MVVRTAAIATVVLLPRSTTTTVGGAVVVVVVGGGEGGTLPRHGRQVLVSTGYYLAAGSTSLSSITVPTPV